MRITTKNSKETKKLGELLGREISQGVKNRAFNTLDNRALVLSLEGDLGSGKTTFVQGMAKGLGTKEVPKSPTFIIMQVFELPGRHLRLVHIDAYRISGKDLEVLGWKKLIKNPKNVIIVEWGTRLKKYLPYGSMKIEFEHGKKLSERTVKIE